MAIVKVLFVNANGDYQEVSSTADTIQAFGFDASGQQITNVANGTANSDAVNYGQLMAAINGFDWKASVRAATVAALAAVTYTNGASGVGATLTANANGALAAIDGVTLIVGDRVLIKNQAAGLQNGIYTLTDAGSAGTPFIFTRALDADQDAEVTAGLTVGVEEGTALQDHIFMLMTNNPITMGTTAQDYQKIVVNSLIGGAGISFSGETISVDMYTNGGLQEIGAGDAAQLAVKAADISGSGLVANGDTIHVDIDWATAATDNKAWKASDLYSTTTGKGASTIGIEDVGGYTSATNVEAALQELYASSGIKLYTVGAGGVTKGDLVYFSANDTVRKMPINAAHEGAGLALETVAAAGLVAIQTADYLIPGALVGATVDTKYYWSGTALTTTLPAASGAYVWKTGMAVNATDLLVHVEFVKKNA
jgi:hypothetical protein